MPDQTETEETETDEVPETQRTTPENVPFWDTRVGRLLQVVIFAALFFGIRAYQRRDLPSGPAPALSAVSLDGEPLSLSTEKPTLVYFWATWCGVCSAMKGAVDDVSDDHNVITIAVQSGDEASIRAALPEGSELPVISDPSGALAAQWNVSAYPTAFFVSPEGEIEFVEVGYTTGPGMRARMFLAD